MKLVSEESIACEATVTFTHCAAFWVGPAAEKPCQSGVRRHADGGWGVGAGEPPWV